MAKDNKVVESTGDDKRTGSDEPFSNGVKSPDELRKPTVSTPEGTFDERTSVSQPFITPDGHQDNGQEDLDEVEGAKAPAAREGNTSTVEETEKAIADGKVEGAQNKKEL